MTVDRNGAKSEDGMNSGGKKLSISFVIPIYNEEPGLAYLRSELALWIGRHPELDVRLILVNDGSSDASYPLLKKWASDDENVTVVSFARNFGHQLAVTAGLFYVETDCAVIIDADLQDPLDVVDRMIESFKQGNDIVYGKRKSRKGESVFKKVTAWLFYRFMRFLIHKDMPTDTGDFRLVSKAVLDVLNSMPERHRFLRGMFAWVGFKQAAVEYERDSRKFGETKYPLSKMVALAANAAVSFSAFPLRVISLSGFCVAMFGLCLGLYAVMGWLFYDGVVSGWTSLMIFLSLLGGAILVSLGVLGEYIARIFEEVKGRPLYVVEDVINGGGK